MLWAMRLGTDFSGIGAPEMALKYLGIDFESVFACEIDKFARQSFQQLHNPKTFYNDITKRNHKDVEQLDLYVAGFPCQSFSMAGKRKGFDEARGTLFFNVADFIKINQPKVFVLENVKGLLSHDKGRTFQTIVDILSNGGGTQNGQIGLDVFDDGLGYHIYWQVLNTKDYGIPQNRERIFIVGFKNFKKFRFPKKLYLNKTLKNILEKDVNEKYFLSDKMTKFVTNSNYKDAKPVSINGIAPCQTTSRGRTCFEVVAHSLHPRCGDPKKGGTGHLSKSDGTSYCLDTGNAQAIEIKSGALRTYPRTKNPDKDRKEGRNKRLELRADSIANSLTTHEYDSLIVKKLNKSTERRKIRRLTPLECWRLQGFKDEDFYKVKDVSDNQLYKQAGNSITVNVLMHLFKKIYA
jgi:DNA (cytosine-5)-methyltransferase 1